MLDISHNVDTSRYHCSEARGSFSGFEPILCLSNKSLIYNITRGRGTSGRGGGEKMSFAWITASALMQAS